MSVRGGARETLRVTASSARLNEGAGIIATTQRPGAGPRLDIEEEARMSGNVFINYRRDDSAGWAGRLHDRLVRTLPARRVFIDVDDIPPGEDFAGLLDAQVAQCDVFLAVIGPRWLGITDAQGRRRLDDPEDMVRIEVESALQRGKQVIPVLVQGAAMPADEALPAALAPLAFRIASPLRPDPDFRADLLGLVAALRAHADRHED